MIPKIPTILLDNNSVPAFSLFNTNDWSGKSKPIILSCAANYGLLLYSLDKVENIFKHAVDLCTPSFNDLKIQWKTAKWDLEACQYLVDIPELHLSIHSFLTALKTFLDIFVQLISSEGIVSGKIHGFHKNGSNVGGRLLLILQNNSQKSKEHLASLLYNLICKHKKIWIDQAVNSRDLFVHPENGLSKVMFSLLLSEVNGDLKLENILKPHIDDEEFDIYAGKTISRVEEFCKKFLAYLRSE